MRAVRLAPRDYREQRWRNGGGFTRELMREPPEGGSADFLWRLSIAEVAASGPFSAFPGYRRTLMLLEGGGLELDFGRAGKVHLTGPYERARFDGGWSTRCRLLAGPVRDLNLIVSESLAEHRLRALLLSSSVALESCAATLLLICLGDRLNAAWDEGESELERLELLRLDRTPQEPPFSLHLQGLDMGGAVAVGEIFPR